MYKNKLSKEEYIEKKKGILSDFSIDVTSEMIDKISELYPNERLIENYIRSIVYENFND